MGNFYHDQQRIIGFVLLALGMLFAGTWIRSTTFYDGIVIPCASRSFVLVESSNGLVAGHWIVNDGNSANTPMRFTKPLAEVRSFAESPSECGVYNDLILRMLDVGGVPYWIIVIPLIFLSMYLLLSEPRQSSYQPVEKGD